jgi:hypothetical protein
MSQLGRIFSRPTNTTVGSSPCKWKKHAINFPGGVNSDHSQISGKKTVLMNEEEGGEAKGMMEQEMKVMKIFERSSVFVNLLVTHAESFIDIYRQVQYTVRYKMIKYKADILNTKVK